MGPAAEAEAADMTAAAEVTWEATAPSMAAAAAAEAKQRPPAARAARVSSLSRICPRDPPAASSGSWGMYASSAACDSEECRPCHANKSSV